MIALMIEISDYSVYCNALHLNPTEFEMKFHNAVKDALIALQTKNALEAGIPVEIITRED